MAQIGHYRSVQITQQKLNRTMYLIRHVTAGKVLRKIISLRRTLVIMRNNAFRQSCSQPFLQLLSHFLRSKMNNKLCRLQSVKLLGDIQKAFRSLVKEPFALARSYISRRQAHSLFLILL